MGLLYVLALGVAAFAFAWVERGALAVAAGTIAFVVTVAALAISLRVVDAVQRRTRVTIDLDEGPASTTQRLELMR